MERRITRTRTYSPEVAHKLIKQGLHPLLARLFAARGVTDITDTSSEWNNLISPSRLTQVELAASVLADAIAQGKRLLIIADYDCDGATACAVGLRGLRALGAKVDYLVPNRFETGYGLSPEVVRLASDHPAGKPDLLVTVDNGIASVDGVKLARELGMEVLVTDHHLPGDQLPDAVAIVNPNQPNCGFPSKNLAGVGVIFYVLMATRAEMRKRGVFTAESQPRLDTLVDLVALGTVADVVKLDANNRLLVSRGLARIRQGQTQPGILALFAVSGRDPANANAFDLGFTIGPRINAAGRLTDMRVGIECLSTDDPDYALALARQLDDINQQRRQIESVMKDQALTALESFDDQSMAAALCVYHPDWHQGVVGLVASRLKEKYYRPVIAFAPGDDGNWRGSGRSIPDVHLRDALDLVAKRNPGMILKFGGHAMAAGLTLADGYMAQFEQSLAQAVIDLTGKERFEAVIDTDGSLELASCNVQAATLIEQQVWGAGFAAPVFEDSFTVLNQRLVGGKHLKLQLERQDQRFDAIWFNQDTPLPDRIKAVYRIATNTWQSRTTVQLMVDAAWEDD